MNRYEALKHAVKAHAGQVDKCGQPYILHPIAVAEVFDRPNLPVYLFDIGPARVEDAVVVGLLHDVWEDTRYVLPRLPSYLAEPLAALTRVEGETYDAYIIRLCADPVAMLVKLADLWHNLSPQRQDCLPAAEAKSLQGRYLKARDRIWEALGYEWWPKSEGGS